MRIEQHISTSWASTLSGKVVSDVIHSLKKTDATLSGDSGLRNAWEEVCAQVQGEWSADWSIYEDTIADMLRAVVEELDGGAQLALWTVTGEGMEYVVDHHDDEDGAAEAPLMLDDVVVYLKGQLLSVAADYESPSLYRYIWG